MPRSTTKCRPHGHSSRFLFLLLFSLTFLLQLSLSVSNHITSSSTNTTSTTKSSPPSFRVRYGAIFIWHAVSACVAWALIAPLAHAFSRFLKRARSKSYFQLHRTCMLIALFLTLQTYFIAVVFASNSCPDAHKLLGTLVTFLALLQAAAGVARPDAGPTPARRLWTNLHRLLGALTLAFAAFTIHHSMFVFALHKAWIRALTAVLSVALGVIVVVECIPSSVVKAFQNGDGQRECQEQYDEEQRAVTEAFLEIDGEIIMEGQEYAEKEEGEQRFGEQGKEPLQRITVPQVHVAPS